MRSECRYFVLAPDLPLSPRLFRASIGCQNTAMVTAAMVKPAVRWSVGPATADVWDQEEGRNPGRGDADQQ
jgi:hypothetical protein